MGRIKPQALLLQSKKKKGPARIGIPTIIASCSVLILLVLSVVIVHRHRAKSDQDNESSRFDLFEGRGRFEFGRGQRIRKAPRFAVLNTTKGLITVQLSIQGALKTVEEFAKRSMKHEPFMLATSKSYRDSDAFELFITTTAIPHLDDKLLVFGRVVRGEEVVQEIEEVDTDEHFRPKSPVLINSISLLDEL